MFSSDIFNTKSIQTLGKKSLIGKGASGCIIKPPITEEYKKEYIEYKDASPDDVSKLFRSDLEKAFKAELKIFAGIHERDPEHKFTVALKAANAVSSSLITDNQIRACLQDNSAHILNDELIYQIIMEYGGKELTNISKNSLLFTKFLQLFRIFLTGIQRMHSFDVIHRDIKPSNVLLSDLKFSLIDFGISEDAKRVFSKENKEYLTYLYLYYPPEFYIAGLLLKYRNDKERFIQKLDTVLDTMQSEYMKKIFKESQIYNIRNQLQDFINEIKLYNYSYHEVFDEKMAYKCDIYGIGFLVRELGNKISYSSDKEKIVIYNLYKMCTEINPYKRASLEQLISYIDEISKLVYITSEPVAIKPSSPIYSISKQQNAQIVHDLFTGGVSRKRLIFKKLHHQMCNTTSPERSKRAYKVLMAYS